MILVVVVMVLAVVMTEVVLLAVVVVVVMVVMAVVMVIMVLVVVSVHVSSLRYNAEQYFDSSHVFCLCRKYWASFGQPESHSRLENDSSLLGRHSIKIGQPIRAPYMPSDIIYDLATSSASHDNQLRSFINFLKAKLWRK
ncbi:hypothetical protein PoB_003532500 [Plakobranchus ocellatus]|uniref:Uncharacterized protein n=1 Tax=Plakobranchus ocellatus TaxID=259542 RepID=A0AAV4APM2_9GAST|nr:hypothetical protein PoB_003532500 [Plakobranchus ocellatus]